MFSLAKDEILQLQSGIISIRKCELKDQIEMRIDDLSKEVKELAVRKHEMKDQVEMTIDDFSKVVKNKPRFTSRQYLIIPGLNQSKRFFLEPREKSLEWTK